jgi:hypothetical protein
LKVHQEGAYPVLSNIVPLMREVLGDAVVIELVHYKTWSGDTKFSENIRNEANQGKLYILDLTTANDINMCASTTKAKYAILDCLGSSELPSRTEKVVVGPNLISEIEQITENLGLNEPVEESLGFTILFIGENTAV